MKRTQSEYVSAQPARRPLKIFATDPMLGRTAGNRVAIDVANELLMPGPAGERIVIIDYDGGHNRFYPPVDLNDPAILMQGGLEPTESDPRFHQQMVYAVAKRTLENFDRALGRVIDFRKKGYDRLRLIPHAFYGANAFYDRDLHAILFGYFRADRNDPGENLPGQNVFTCLSHDIIAHEMTHAVVDRLKRYFMEPTGEDVLAFHEGFSDIVALFQHFAFQEILRQQIQKSRADLRSNTLLVQLARQFGYATGAGKALRSALDQPDAKLYKTTIEPHKRGAILVAAVFDAYFATYQRRIRDLVRIATGGTGELPSGDLHPDLVNRVANEASATAQQILTMCIRAFDYLPPVDIMFGDYLRALVTADYELVPRDEFGERGAIIEAFRMRGIYPENVPSLAEESLLWENADPGIPSLPLKGLDMLQELFFAAADFGRGSAPWIAWDQPTSRSKRPTSDFSEADADLEITSAMAKVLHSYAQQNTRNFHLSDDPNIKIEVHGFHPVFRVAPNGQLLIELVVQFAQTDRSRTTELGGLPLRGGTTLIASADGVIRYVISKPLPSGNLSLSKKREAEARLERQLSYLRLTDMADPKLSYYSAQELAIRMKLRMNMAALHQGV
jgi:hypothetical protein